MDLKKIGAYIAGKRKAQGLTQRELAEKLGMSDKSVSKWERGVCLPDVSVYWELCSILGIRLSEFLAGEDLAEESIPRRSEETLVSVSAEGEKRRNRSRRIIAALLSAAVLLCGALVWVLAARAGSEGNFLAPFPRDSAERKTAELLSGAEGAFLYRYKTDGSFRSMTVLHTAYRKGELVTRETLFSTSPEDELLGEGILGLVPDFDDRSVKFLIAGKNVKISTRLPIPGETEGWEFFGRAAVEREDAAALEDGKETVFLALNYGLELRVLSCQELEAGNVPAENEEVHAFSVVFSRQAADGPEG